MKTNTKLKLDEELRKEESKDGLETTAAVINITTRFMSCYCCGSVKNYNDNKTQEDLDVSSAGVKRVFLSQCFYWILHLPWILITSLWQVCQRKHYSNRRHSECLEKYRSFDATNEWCSCSGNRYLGDKWEKDEYKQYAVEMIKGHEDDISHRLSQELMLICNVNNVEKLVILQEVWPKSTFENVLVGGLPFIHQAILCGSYTVAIKLIDQAPVELLKHKSSGEQFDGCSPLHMAIMMSQKELVKTIIQRLPAEDVYELINAECKGSGVSLAFLPIQMAVLSGDPKLVLILIEHGAELNVKDSRGYNIFHYIILAGVKNIKLAEEIFDSLIESVDTWIRISKKINSNKELEVTSDSRIGVLLLLFKLRDNHGFTPLKLAAKFGMHSLMKKILGLSGVYCFPLQQNAYKKEALYEMSELDPLLNQFGHNGSVLETIALKYGDEFLRCLTLPPVNKLVSLKWERYKRHFHFWGLFHLLFMAFYTRLAFFELFPNFKPCRNETNLISNCSRENLRYRFSYVDGIVLSVGISYLIFSISILVSLVKISRRIRLSGFSTCWHFNALMNIDILIFAWVTLGYVFAKAVQSPRDIILLALSLLVGWMYLFLFTKVFKTTGFFSIMFHKILIGDITRFLFIGGIILISFTIATLAIFSAEDDVPPEFSSFLTTAISYLKLCLGLVDLNVLFLNRHYIFSTLLFLAFVLLENILLMNLLIAAMTDTHSALSSDTELLCTKLRMSDVILMEWMLPVCLQLRQPLAWEQCVQSVTMPDGSTYRRFIYLTKVTEE